jgi:hypothetical protein
LKTENEKLRQLLSNLGVSPCSVEAYLRQGCDKAMKRKVAIPALHKTDPSIQMVKSPPSDCCSVPHLVQHNTDGNLSVDSGVHEPSASDIDTADQKEALRTNVRPQISPDTPAQTMVSDPETVDRQEKTGDKPMESPTTAKSISDCLCGRIESLPASHTTQDLTPCTEAWALIQQYNTLGADISDIRRRLQDGFRKEVTAGEHCRVTNQALFRILDEISGNFS